MKGRILLALCLFGSTVWAQGWVMPEVELPHHGWTALFKNPAELAFGSGSYGFSVGMNTPLISVSTKTGIIGYDGGYSLRHRSNSETKPMMNYQTGFDIPAFGGKLGFGLFRLFGRMMHLDLYEVPLGYYDTIPSVSMPQFDWKCDISSLEFSVGWAAKIGELLSVGLSGGYITARSAYRYVKLLPISNFISDSTLLDSIPMQFVYVPEFREFNGDGHSWSYGAGVALSFGKFRLGLSAVRYQPVAFDGTESRTAYLPQDSLLAESIDSTVFSGGTQQFYVGTRLRLIGFNKYRFSLNFELADNADVKFTVERFVWDMPILNSTDWPPGFRIDVLVQRDTFYLDWNDINRYTLEIRYETIHKSVLFFGLGYTEALQSDNYTPLFGEPGPAVSLKFAINYFLSDDLALEAGYEFVRHHRTTVGELGSADAQTTLAGEYAASNDKVIFGFIYRFPK